MLGFRNRKLFYRKAIERALSWLVSHQHADGGFGAVETMSATMVTPAALLYCGRPAEAARAISWQRKAYVREDGYFDPPEIRANRASSLAEQPYAPSWMIYSAHTNLAFDMSLRAVPHLLTMQDPVTGGMFGRAEESASGCGIINTAVTAVASQAALITGYLEESRRMADHLTDRVIACNREWDKVFFPVWDSERGLCTHSGVPPTGNMPSRIDRAATNQHHHLTGALVAVLSDMHAATRKTKYLDAARQVFEFAAGAPPNTLESTLAHKLAWGSVWLYRETGDPRCLEVACRICDHLIDGQLEDGAFVHWALIRSAEQWPYSSRVNLTSQFALWLQRVEMAL